MPPFDAVNLSLVWCIGLLAVIQTINAKGVWRAALSAILTVVILAVAGVSTYLKVQGYESFVYPRSVQESAMGNTGAKSEVENRFFESAGKIAKEGLNLASQIGKIKALPKSLLEPEREKAESKALALRNATAQLNSRAVALFHNPSQRDSYSQLVRATENLRLAGYSMHVYTTLENAEEREAQFKQGKSRAETAKKELEACIAELETHK